MSCTPPPVPGVLVPTATVAFAVTVLLGLIAESVYVVVTLGDTVIEVLETAPMPWLRLVELAFVTVHERTELPPREMLEGVAVNEIIEGCKRGVATVALQLLEATVEEASVP